MSVFLHAILNQIIWIIIYIILKRKYSNVQYVRLFTIFKADI